MKDRTAQEQGSTVPKRAKQDSETHDWSWVEGAVWTDRMMSALGNGVKGGKWFSLIDKVYAPATLKAAWEKVRANRGTAGVDGISIQRFAQDADRYLEELSKSLKENRYVPCAIRRVDIPKSDGSTRPLGIPTVKDRIVQTAVKLAIEPIFEKEFRQGSYGFRPGRGCKDALREVDRLISEGYCHVVDADIKKYFDCIPHQGLVKRVETRISDGRVLELIRGWLQQEIMKGMERWTPMTGTPQGAVISPLLANIYLHPLDQLMESKGYKMVRYADDFVVLCRSQEEAECALAVVKDWVRNNGLELHPSKTHIGDCRQPGEGFEFLGYLFVGGKRWIRKASLTKFKDKVRCHTRRTQGQSLKVIIETLNPFLRGWFNYFKHAHHTLFNKLDGFIRRRLRSLLRKQEKRPGFGRCLADQKRWNNAFFAESGLFALHAAWVSARHSR